MITVLQIDMVTVLLIDLITVLQIDLITVLHVDLITVLRIDLDVDLIMGCVDAFCDEWRAVIPIPLLLFEKKNVAC